MKTFQFFKVIPILFFFLSINLPTFPQDYPVSNNTLVTGDTVILRRWDLGFWQPDTIWAKLGPYHLFYEAQCPICFDDTISSFKAEAVDDSTFDFYFYLPLGMLPGTYDIIGYSTPEEPHIGSEMITVYTPPYIFQQPENSTVCLGDSMAFETKALGNSLNDLSYQWYHNDVKISESFQGLLILPLVEVRDTGDYYCVISNQYGIDTTLIVTLDLNPFPSSPGYPIGPERFCPGTDSSIYNINSDPLATGYSWNLIPGDAGTIQQNDTSCIIYWDQDFTGNAELYVDLVANCGMNTSDTLEITIPGISTNPEICIVGIDEHTGKYRIVWERSKYGSAQLFKVFRESNQADVYMEIGTVEADEISFFVDSSSVPDMIPHRYKISYLDTCGLESELSIHHQSMHLAANIGINGVVNLSWSAYTGIPFPAYNIYRGSHSDSMNFLIQVPSTVTTFTDSDPPIGNVNYQVGMSNPAGCDPVKKSEPDYSSSMSNMDKVLVTGVFDVNEDQPFKIFPNPVTDILQIQYKNLIDRPIQIAVYNSLGEAVLQDHVRAVETALDVSPLSPGIYILQMIDDLESYSARFVIRRK